MERSLARLGIRLSERENDEQGRRMYAAQSLLRRGSVAPKESPCSRCSVGRGGNSPIRFRISLLKKPSGPRSGSEAAILGSAADSSLYRPSALSRASGSNVQRTRESPKL